MQRESVILLKTYCWWALKYRDVMIYLQQVILSSGEVSLEENLPQREFLTCDSKSIANVQHCKKNFT